MTAQFSLTAELLDREIEALRQRLEALVQERDALLFGRNGQANTSPSVRRVQEGEPVTLHVALDRVLEWEAGRPLSVKEILAKVRVHKIKSNPGPAAVRGTLNTKATTYGWRRTGSGKATRWFKPPSGVSAQEGST